MIKMGKGTGVMEYSEYIKTDLSISYQCGLSAPLKLMANEVTVNLFRSVRKRDVESDLVKMSAS